MFCHFTVGWNWKKGQNQELLDKCERGNKVASHAAQVQSGKKKHLCQRDFCLPPKNLSVSIAIYFLYNCTLFWILAHCDVLLFEGQV